MRPGTTQTRVLCCSVQGFLKFGLGQIHVAFVHVYSIQRTLNALFRLRDAVVFVRISHKQVLCNYVIYDYIRVLGTYLN